VVSKTKSALQATAISVILREEGPPSALTTIGLASSFDSPLVPAAMSAGVLATDH
jgi:hypothetical protein